MSDKYPDHIEFDYKISISKRKNSYQLLHYNSPYEDSERELEDICLILEGKTPEGKEFPAYKAIKWEELDPGKYEFLVRMTLIRNLDKKSFDQVFKQLEMKRLDSEQNKG